MEDPVTTPSTHHSSGRQPKRQPKGTPIGGEFAPDRHPSGPDLDAETTKPMKRDDKWLPSRIDWKRLELVMIVERDTYEDENGREHSVPHDYLIRENLPLQFEEAQGRNDILANYDVSGLDPDYFQCRCGVCGHVLKYGGVLVDFESHDGVMVGFDCLETYNAVADGLEDARFQARRAAAVQRGVENVRRACEENEGLAEAFDEMKEHYIVSDIKDRLRRYGTISEKQVALVLRIARESRERERERQARDALVALAPDAPSGKQTVRGTILSMRNDVSHFGGYDRVVVKMLVQSEEGWKVWVTAPSSILNIPVTDENNKFVRYTSAARGDTIQFDATLEPSNDDSKFAFGKRPTKALVVQRGESDAVGLEPKQ